MCGGHISQTSAPFGKLACNQSMLVNMNPVQSSTNGLEYPMGHFVARVLHHDHISLVDKYPGTHVEHLLRPTRNHQLFNVAGQPSSSRKIGLQLLTQSKVSKRVNVGKASAS